MITPQQLDAKWNAVFALREVQTLLARDLVARRGQPDAAMDAAAHETAYALISDKLKTANLDYYEARAAFEAQPRPDPHSHSH